MNRNLLGLLCALLIVLCSTAYSEESPEDGFLDMSLEDLMNVEVEPTASLTVTSRKMAPGTVTTVTSEDIEAANCRSLDELLDIYVPNLEIIRSHWEQQNMGLRGIMGDRDDKYLLLINGRVMNEKTHYGAATERDLPMLGDIHHIDIVRGPGSALYGPGAVSMVINIVTYDADTFQGTEITGKMGAVEEYYITEFKHGTKFENGLGVYFYGAIGSYPGASPDDSHQVYAVSFPSESSYEWWDPAWGTNTGPEWLPGDGTMAGEPMRDSAVGNDHGSARGMPPVKLHFHLTHENWDYWTRYTRNGKKLVYDSWILQRQPIGWADYAQPLVRKFYEYQQLTNYFGYHKELTDNTNLEMSVSYDRTDLDRQVGQGDPAEAFREQKYYGKAIMTHNISDNHKTAFGLEYQHLELGYASGGWPNLDYGVSSRLAPEMPRWSTDMYSALGEYQWTINDYFTFFGGMRLDDHTYSPNMFSPRASLIYSINDRNTMKFMWARSVRASYEEEMKAESLAGNDESEPEELESFELRYESFLSKNFSVGATGYFYDLDIVGWAGDPAAVVSIGNQKTYGGELEANYKTEKIRCGISHGYTKLSSFSLNDDSYITSITGEPYGYGNDLARWSNHVTKLNANYMINDQWSVNGSLRVYWGFAGLKDYSKYERTRQDYPRDNEGWDAAYRANCYLNLGLNYRPTEKLSIGLNGYNLLGFFEPDLNKRNYGGSESADYRTEAAAFGATLKYRF